MALYKLHMFWFYRANALKYLNLVSISINPCEILHDYYYFTALLTQLHCVKWHPKNSFPDYIILQSSCVPRRKRLITDLMMVAPGSFVSFMYGMGKMNVARNKPCAVAALSIPAGADKIIPFNTGIYAIPHYSSLAAKVIIGKRIYATMLMISPWKSSWQQPVVPIWFAPGFQIDPALNFSSALAGISPPLSSLRYSKILNSQD